MRIKLDDRLSYTLSYENIKVSDSILMLSIDVPPQEVCLANVSLESANEIDYDVTSINCGSLME